MAKGFWVKTSAGNSFKTITGFFVKVSPSTWQSVNDAWVKVKQTGTDAFRKFWESVTSPVTPIEILTSYTTTTELLRLQGKNYRWDPSPSTLFYTFTYVNNETAVTSTLTSSTSTTNPLSGSSIIVPSSTTYRTISKTVSDNEFTVGGLSTYKFTVTGSNPSGATSVQTAEYSMRTPKAPTVTVEVLSATSVKLTITAASNDDFFATYRYIVSTNDSVSGTIETGGGRGGYGASSDPTYVTLTGLTSGRIYSIYVTPFTGSTGTTESNASGYRGLRATVSSQGTGLTKPTFGAVTTTSNGFYAVITNYDSTYTYNLSATKGTPTIDTVTNIGRITVTGLNSGESSDVTVYASKTGYVNGESAILSGSTTMYAPLKPTLLLISQSATGFSGMIDNHDGDHYSYTIELVSTTHSPSSGVGVSLSSPNTQFFYVTGLNVGESATIKITSKVLAGTYKDQTSTSDNFTSSAVNNGPTNVSLSTSGSNYSVSWTGFSNPNINKYTVYPYTSTDGVTFTAAGGFGYSTSGLTTSLTFSQSFIGTGVKQLYVVVYGANDFGTVGDASPNSNTINNPNYIDPNPPPALTPTASASVSGNVLTFTVSNGTPSAWYSEGGLVGYIDPSFSFDGTGRSATFVNMTDGQTVSGRIEINITGYGYIYTNTVSYTQVGAPPPPPPPPPTPPPPPPFTPPAGKSVGVTTLIRTPNGLVPAGALNVGDTLLSADIAGFPYENYDGATEFALGWADNNPEIILKETLVTGMSRRISHFAVAINEDLFSDTHYILIKRGPNAMFVYTAYVEPTDRVYSYASNSWEPIYMLEKVSVDHQVISINCEPYDIFFTENTLVHDSVEI